MASLGTTKVAVILALLGSIAVFIVTTLSAFALFRSAAMEEAEVQAGQRGEVVGRVALAPFLTDELVDLDPVAVSSLDRAGTTLIADGGASHVKVWSRAGMVLWADEKRLWGRTFPMDAEQRSLFESLGVSIALSDLDRQENEFDSVEGPQLLEVYFAMQTAQGQPVLVETYYPMSMVDEIAAEYRQRFLPVLFGGLALLTLAQVHLVILLARRLSRLRAERERLLAQVISVSDAERRRIAAEVHDGSVQELIGMSFALSAAVDAAPEDMKESLRTLAASARTTVRSLRSLLMSIYPFEVPDEGWAAGIEDLVGSLRLSGIDVEVRVPNQRMSPMEELLLLRVAREALRNTSAHAGASRVEVVVTEHRGAAVLEVADNGVGFSAETVAGRRRDGHLGLQLLSDLAANVGADLDVLSRPGQGTTVRLELAGKR